MSYYRTKTYVAGAWDEDHDAIEQLYRWNQSDYYSFSFVNVHDFKQARDGSKACSIKKSLSDRMDMCKTFILIVGDSTNKVTKGSCVHCNQYRSWSNYCNSYASQTTKSFIEFECDKARREFLNNNIKILVLYNSSYVYKERCPESVRDIGKHIPMKKYGDWDYAAVRDAFTWL